MTSTTLWRERILRRADNLLDRIQWLFVLFNCLLAVLAPLELTYPDAPTGTRAGVVVGAALALGVWSVVYFRRSGRPALLDAIPPLLLLAGGIAAGGSDWMFARTYVVLFLVSLYRPSRYRHAALAGAYLLTYQTATYVTTGDVLAVGIIDQAISMLVVIGIMQTLAVAVKRHERFAQRDALLTGVVGGLIGVRDSQRVNHIVADAALRLVDVPGALVTVWRSDVDRLVRVGLAGRESHPLVEADLRMLPEEFSAIYHQGRPAYLDAAQLNRIHAHYGVEEPFVSAIVAPMLRDGEPKGLIVVGSPEPLDEDLLRVFERFAHEVALAQQLAEREAMLRGLVENSSDVIAVADDAGTFTYVSPAITATVGADADVLMGLPMGNVLRRSAGDPVSLPGELPQRTPVALVMVAGERELDVEVTANPLPDGSTILNIRDVSERRRLEAEIEYRAFHDSVTGLPNRALLMDRLEHAVRRRDRDGGILAVAVIDVDDFKGVNDGLGHAAGDELLQRIADRLTSALRDVDTAARFGGDEFAVVLEDFSDTAAVTTVVDRILNVLRRPLLLEGRQVAVSASIGVTVADRAVDPVELIRNADAAMYAAKKAGKNRWAAFEPTMHAQGLNRLELRTQLEEALREGQFELHYQPILDLGSQVVTGFEALVRWNHASRGVVAPMDFIPIAEETGLIVPLGRWVLDEACRQVSEWQATSGEPVSLSVNLSAVQLRTTDIVDDVSLSLAASGLDPASLTLEVTETALMGDLETAAVVLGGLKALGVRLAIDDFGTGYSSFAHLQSLPVDAIKVDRSFVAVVGDGPEQAAYAKAIVNIAQTLGLDTVAEGVEVEEHSELLRSWGCGFGQGWLWHPALPASEAGSLLDRSHTAAAH